MKLFHSHASPFVRKVMVVAHELAHVLMDSGAHDNASGNLMAEDTAPQNTQLNAAQCAQMRNTGTRNGLLRPDVLAPGELVAGGEAEQAHF